jgi:hypothetical protein
MEAIKVFKQRSNMICLMFLKITLIAVWQMDSGRTKSKERRLEV